jgi:hypothetical protein
MLCYIMLCYAMQYSTMPLYAMLYYVLLCYVILCNNMLFVLFSWIVMLCFTSVYTTWTPWGQDCISFWLCVSYSYILCRHISKLILLSEVYYIIMLCYANICCVILCYAMLCNTLLCHYMLCYIMFCWLNEMIWYSNFVLYHALCCHILISKTSYK